MPDDTAQPAGFPPREVAAMLRLEGLVALVLALVAFQMLGGNWWLFALLILAPDLAFFGMLGGGAFGTRLYNAAHTYTIPAAIGAIAWFTGAGYLVPFMLIWIAHIGGDRALGYGLKYLGSFHQTHLGRIGRAKRAQKLPGGD
jgi:hypothetical protein